MIILLSTQIHFILHYITYPLLQCKEYIQITSNHSKINVERKKQQSKQNDNFAFNTNRFYTTLYQTYPLLQCKQHIHIINNHSTICGKIKQQSKENDNFVFNTNRFCTTLYHTYPLLKCKEYIHIRNNDSRINVERKNNRVNKMTILPSIQIDFILHFIILTRY